FFFFFQAEDGIRDYKVTGVQTCALPISPSLPQRTVHIRPLVDVPNPATSSGARETVCCTSFVSSGPFLRLWVPSLGDVRVPKQRSEERRVGKECRSRGWPDELKKKCESR